jgi:hypothetical protein
MLNGVGGFILFGINDNGDFFGQQVTAKTLVSTHYRMSIYGVSPRGLKLPS